MASRNGNSRMVKLVLVLTAALLFFTTPAQAALLNPNPPATTARLVFIHHSVGEDWLHPEYGNLRQILNNNNYYVTDSNYNWGPPDQDVGEGTIGDHTDIGHWYNWFLGPHSSTYLSDLYTTNHLSESAGTNTLADPGGQSTVIMFKSCFPNGQQISGNPYDPPRVSSPGNPNPIWGRGVGYSEDYTVSNIKGLYRDLLQYFATRQDKLFILITFPPSYSGDVSPESAANARAVNTWLVHHWLDGYRGNNVAVFDFFNVLTSNGGNRHLNDLGAATGNHHRFGQGQVWHLIGFNSNVAAYPSGDDGTDSHPTSEGHQKATGEYLPLLNIAYHAWKGTGGVPFFMGRSPAALAALELLLLD